MGEKSGIRSRDRKITLNSPTKGENFKVTPQVDILSTCKNNSPSYIISLWQTIYRDSKDSEQSEHKWTPLQYFLLSTKSGNETKYFLLGAFYTSLMITTTFKWHSKDTIRWTVLILGTLRGTLPLIVMSYDGHKSFSNFSLQKCNLRNFWQRSRASQGS